MFMQKYTVLVGSGTSDTRVKKEAYPHPPTFITTVTSGTLFMTEVIAGTLHFLHNVVWMACLLTVMVWANAQCKNHYSLLTTPQIKGKYGTVKLMYTPVRCSCTAALCQLFVAPLETSVPVQFIL